MYTDPKLIKKLYRLMYNAHNLFVHYSISYYVTGGTLLGAVRHKGIIPWDNDLDVEVFEYSLPTLKSTAFKESLAKYNIQLKKNPDGWYRLIDKTSDAALDIFISKYNPKKGTVELTGKAKDFFPKCAVWKVENLFPLQKYKFGANQVFGPKNPKPYLDACYGKSWSTVGYVTLDSTTHLELDKPIKVPVKRFIAAREFYTPTKKQTLPRKGDIIYTKEYTLNLYDHS